MCKTCENRKARISELQIPEGGDVEFLLVRFANITGGMMLAAAKEKLSEFLDDRMDLLVKAAASAAIVAEIYARLPPADQATAERIGHLVHEIQKEIHEESSLEALKRILKAGEAAA